METHIDPPRRVAVARRFRRRGERGAPSFMLKKTHLPAGKNPKKNDVQAFVERMKFLNDFEVKELRRTSLETRLRQFFTLLGWANTFGWKEKLSAGVDEVRARWVKLKLKHGKKKYS